MILNCQASVSSAADPILTENGDRISIRLDRATSDDVQVSFHFVRYEDLTELDKYAIKGLLSIATPWHRAKSFAL